MGEKKQLNTDIHVVAKKKRRVGFFDADSGIEANECIKIFLVSSKEEVGDSNSCCIEPVDLNGFFDDDDGKIYGYQGLKITVWFNIISFSTYVDISYKKKVDGGKGITDLKSAMEKIFADTVVDDKDTFIKSFSSENNLISSIISQGELLFSTCENFHVDTHNRIKGLSSDLKVIRLKFDNAAAGILYCRLVPLVLLLIDGSNPIEVTDPRWELYALIQCQKGKQGDVDHRLVGFTVIYRFYQYPEHVRMRLGQILVLPPFQRRGFGRQILEVVNNVAVSEDVYDLTVEEPLDLFQRVRTCFDVQRLMTFAPIQEALDSAVSVVKEAHSSEKEALPRMVPSSAVEQVRRSLKINRKQFLQCWEVLVYLRLDPIEKYLHNFVVLTSNRIRADLLGKDTAGGTKKLVEIPSEYSPEMSFAVVPLGNGEGNALQVAENQASVEEQLQKLVDDRINDIRLIAQKVRRDSPSLQM